MNVRQAYAEAATDTLCRMHPNWSRGKVLETMHHVIKNKLRDPTVYMNNNVTNYNAKICLTKLCGWIENSNAIIAGNGTFYCQPEELESPTGKMLVSLKRGRKAVKKKMFEYKPGSDEYNMLDLDQANKKVIMNAEYGGSGAKTAAFYNPYTPAATTLMAQSIITVMAAFFEGYIGNNHKFWHINEFFDWINKVSLKDEEIPKWIVRPTPDQVFNEVCSHFIMLYPGDVKLIRDYINNLSSDQLTYVHYANNFKDLIRDNPKIQEIIHRILSTLPLYEAAVTEVPNPFKEKFNKPGEDNINSYNQWMSREMFLDPYKIPDSIKDDMEKFTALMSQFVYVEYITPDSIVKLNNHKRNTVLLVDTDSNMLNAGLFVSFITNEIFPGETFGRKKLYNEMILTNVLASALSKSVADILSYYAECHNIGEEPRKELTMKNEFMFRRFFLMSTKKRYAASIALREGNIIYPFKAEIKGMDFIKAGVTNDVSKRFEAMLCDNILFSEELELHNLMRDIKAFEREIYDDLMSGGTKYLKQQQFKAESGYKNVAKAWSLPVFKGSVVWNEIYPNKKVYSLDRVHIVKTTVTSITDLEKIKDKFPKDYENVCRVIFNSSRPEIAKAGIKYICVPVSVKKVPDWILPLIDTGLIISDTVSVFRSILEALQVEEMGFKTPNGNASITSCLISI